MKFALAALLLTMGVPQQVVEGNVRSSVKVTIYEDLQCSDCQKLRSLLDEKILPAYRTRVFFVYRDFPLPKHDWARAAAVAARWVYQQNPELGIRFRREIMSEQAHLASATLKPWLIDFAIRNKLDSQGIVASLDDPALNSLIERDYQGGLGRGIAHTPTVIVGNQSIVETVIYEDLARLLDSELKR